MNLQSKVNIEYRIQRKQEVHTKVNPKQNLSNEYSEKEIPLKVNFKQTLANESSGDRNGAQR